jgi:predicted ATPase
VNARVEEIRLQDFRAIENARLRLSDLTVLVGRNGAGKSSVLDAIEFMREAVTDSLPNALDRRDGLAAVKRLGSADDDAVGVAIVLRVELPGRHVRVLYGFQLRGRAESMCIEEVLVVAPARGMGFTRRGGDFASDVPVTPIVPNHRLVLPLVADEELWAIVLAAIRGMRAYEIVPQNVAASVPIQPSTSLLPTGGNAGDVLNDLASRPEAYAQVVAALKAVTLGITGVKAVPHSGRRAVVFTQEIRGVAHDLSASQMSQGTLRALGELLALHQSPQPTLVLLDEVEDSIHPRALEAMLEAVEGVLDRFPVVLTTHSPEVLSKRQVLPERVRVLEWKNGVSRVYPLSRGTLESVDAVTTAGDLLRFNALWPSDEQDAFAGDLLALDDEARDET